MTEKTIQSYRELILWQRAVQVCVAIYRFTARFPKEEIYGLTSQLRRASVSVPSNISEGYGRLSKEQFRHFLGVAKGSNLELQTQLVIAKELGFGDLAEAERIESLSFEVGKMLMAMIRKL
jgi:four helix bundle protein